MSGNGKRIAILLGVGLALAPLLLFAYLGLHSRLLIDDYSHLGLARHIGVWDAMLFWRDVWNGDYSNFLVYGLLAPLGEWAPPLFALFICASAFVAFFWLSKALLAELGLRAQRRSIAIVLAALGAAAAINGLYHIQAFYWLTVAVEYTWPPVMLLLGIALAAAVARRLEGRAGHGVAAAASAVYAFVNAGFSEMYLVFQLSAMSLIALYFLCFRRDPAAKSHRALAIAGLLGTLVSLPLQLTSAGVAYRSAQPEAFGNLARPIRDLPTLLERALDLTLQYLGHQASFAGFMLLVFAGLFLTLSAGDFRRDASERKIAIGGAPLVFALIIQVVFLPILWSHQSDNPQALGRFSYGFMVAVGINLLATAVLLALLWRRVRLAQALHGRQGLMAYCSCILLAVCFLFAITQARNIHYKAASYLFVSAAGSLITLAWQLTPPNSAPRLKRLVSLGAFAAASAVITLFAMLAVTLWGAGYILDRAFTPVIFALMAAGLINGVALGALIRRGHVTDAGAGAGLRWMRLGCLLVALTIAAGIALGHGRRVSHAREEAAIWDSQHEEILRLRDEGDPAVYTKHFPRLITDHLGRTPSRYKDAPLLSHQRLYYGLELCDNPDDCRCPEAPVSSLSVGGRLRCLLDAEGGRG